MDSVCFSRFSAALLFPLAFLLLWGAVLRPAHAAPSDYFRITVQDQDTGRGVPLVELRTVNEVRYYTDSNGIAAVGDPELMGQRVFFKISSPGYEFPADAFGYHGTALTVKAGGSVVLKIKRLNIAERLYRVTGAGIYRDSMLTGQPGSLKQPLLNGQVFGQDTVMAAVYGGRLVWFFGDTNRPSYPLGQFAISGATSALPGQGGLDPGVGVDLTYWTDPGGFSRPMIPIAGAPGPVWIGGLFSMADRGRERLFAHYAEIGKDGAAAVSGLAEFNEGKAVFQPVATYPKGDALHPEGQPFRVREQGKEWLYFETQEMGAFPLVRNSPDLAKIANFKTYQAFTCLLPGTRFQGDQTQLDRAADGHLIWAWKPNTAALGEDEAAKLVAAGKMKLSEILTQLRDIDTDAGVTSHGGSVFWNPYRRRWILITTQVYGSPSFLGEVWLAEADTPVGPWLYARKIATHDHYTFYNPTQHPFFDQDGGRVIYFEGTYTNTYSDVKDLTPRYNYNQLMYKLTLDDPRLSLPVPVYALAGPDGYALRDRVEAKHEWSQVRGIPFFAVPPDRPHAGLVPVPAASLVPLGDQPPGPVLFYALPPMPAAGETISPAAVPLYAYRDPRTNAWVYSTNAALPQFERQSAKPLCRVWRNPSSVLALDSDAQAVMPAR